MAPVMAEYTSDLVEVITRLVDSGNTVVWHPGKRPLLGVSWSEVMGFVCVESTSGGTRHQSLAPGEQAHLSLHARAGLCHA